MSGILFTGGEGPGILNIEHELKAAEFIVAADSGLMKAVEFGVEPDIIVGDMDSLDDHAVLDRFPEADIRHFPEDKDYSDTELGLMELSGAGIQDIVMIGGGGGRIDHFLALLELYHSSLYPSRWYTGFGCLYYVDGDFSLSVLPGDTVSVFALPGTCARYRSEGLKWRLDNHVLGDGSVSLSNRAIKKSVKLKKDFGKIIVVSNY